MNKAKAFIFGYVYALGYVYGLKLKITNDEEIEFRKTKDNQTIAIKNHKVVGGAGSSVGPDKLPTFEYFSKSDKVKNLSLTKRVVRYLKESYTTPIIKPKGLTGCDKLIFSTNGIKETASHINEDKLKVLPYLGYIYRTGHEIGKAKDYHNPSNQVIIHYTQKTLKIDNDFYRVTLISKQAGKVAEFSHYAIDEADAIKK